MLMRVELNEGHHDQSLSFEPLMAFRIGDDWVFRRGSVIRNWKALSD